MIRRAPVMTGLFFFLVVFVTACSTSLEPTTLTAPISPISEVTQTGSEIVLTKPTITIELTSAPTITIPGKAEIRGVVLDERDLPVSAATVRIQTTSNQTQSDEQGHFMLADLEEGKAVTVSAWKDDYYCAKIEKVVPPSNDVGLTLRRYQTNDNVNYEWVPPTGDNSCYSCKPGVTQVWLDNDAHARSATNPRFLSMYNGTDLDGNQSPFTRYAVLRDYGRIPLRPEPNQPYYGPGYKLDFPETAGNCASCHTPSSAIEAAYSVDPNQLAGIDLFGIHCDFCHKIADIQLDPITALPYPNMPGVLSMDIRRPFPEDEDRYQLFFGTFDDDNVPEEDTYLPLIEQSQFCASCHFGIFWDTVVYNSYGEWLESPYSDPQGGKTCQHCHMPSPTIFEGQAITNVAPGMGGVERDPMRIHAHTFPGATNVELLQNSVSMQVDAKLDDNQLLVTVNITNDQTGHHIPTDSPLRQMILLVNAIDANGRILDFQDGSVIPDWGGIGDPTQGYYAGLPGKAFAKILAELWTEISPSGAYWNPTRIVSDNRLPAFASDTSTYHFSPTESYPITVEVKLLFRRAFKELQDQKGWMDEDILMEYQSIILTP